MQQLGLVVTSSLFVVSTKSTASSRIFSGITAENENVKIVSWRHKLC